MDAGLLTPSEGNALFVAGVVVGAAFVLILVIVAVMRIQHRAAKAARRHPGGLTVEKR